MTLLTRNQILESKDSDYRIVNTQEWGGEVRIKAMNGRQRDKFDKFMSEKTKVVDGQVVSIDMTQIKAYLVALSCVDEKGDYIFSVADVEKLNEKSAKALQRVSDAASELSGLDDKKAEETKED